MAGIAIAILLGCLPGVADADPKRFTSLVTLLKATPEFIDGQLSSPSARCVGGRTIQIQGAGATVPTATVLTNDEGGFQIAMADLPAGDTRLLVTAVRPGPGRQRACGVDSAELALDAGTLSGGVSGGAFVGRLSSSSADCVPDRTIELYEISSDPVFVGWNLTNASGDWVIAAAGGAYEARALPAISGGPDLFNYCRPRVSPPWVFEEPADPAFRGPQP